MTALKTRALWQRSRFEWGKTDCILSVCDHVQRETGVDPAAYWRGSYHDEAGAWALSSGYGGVLSLMDLGMWLAGFPRCEPADGLPVVCRIGETEVAGVMFGDRVGFLCERGLVEGRAPILGAWDICRR